MSQVTRPESKETTPTYPSNGCGDSHVVEIPPSVRATGLSAAAEFFAQTPQRREVSPFAQMIGKMGEKACENLEKEHTFHKAHGVKFLNFIRNTYRDPAYGSTETLDAAFKPALDRLITYAQNVSGDETLEGSNAIKSLDTHFKMLAPKLGEHITLFLIEVCERVYN